MSQFSLLVTYLLIAAVTIYVAAFVALLAKKNTAGAMLAFLGWLISAGVMATNWIACGHPPFGSMGHVMVVLSLCFLPVYLLLRGWYNLGWLTVYFVFASGIPLVGSLFMEKEVAWRRVPALQSPWFIPHVTAYMLSYALATVAFVLTIVQLIRARLLKQAETSRYYSAGYQILRLAFPFMTFGLLSGALWAEAAWGVYWSWDSKETWSLITWTLYLAYFHSRNDSRLKPYTVTIQILAFAALITTFLLVNLLPKLASALHSYA
ncbi:MAG: cytochrome c biogenesis protein CcsA [Kiritimatiellae bacterium]|nr:cytochrome c biogenesis protein CcsA [Kiritimatiellia bacterium]MDD5521971.1 cytochrome c biogenesis protein CcsA [Kiritimatiellia bacterium]